MAKARCLWLPPFEKGGIEGDFYSKSSPGPSFCKGGGNSEHP